MAEEENNVMNEEVSSTPTTPKSYGEDINNTTLDESSSSLNSDEQTKESSQSSSSLSDINKSSEKPDRVGFGAKKEKRLYEEIEIPEGISADIVDDVLIVKKNDRELKRNLNILINIKVDNRKIIISAKRMRKVEKKLFGTFKAHIRNMIGGLEENFVFKLHIANVHFPMNVSYDKASNSVVVKNFLGEKKDRIIKLNEDVDVNIDNEIIEISSYDIEKAGIAATRIEKGAKVRGKDRRVYQDGIFIVSKPGRVYL